MRSFAPAAERNKAPLLDALSRCLPERATILEIASGTGQHARHMTDARPDWVWQPSEADPAGLDSIAAWRSDAGPGFLAPVQLDAAERPWAVTGPVDAVLAVNLIHIAPFTVAEALFAEAPRHLRAGGCLLLYGPFFFDEDGAESNRAFDAGLRAQDPRWGVRDCADLTALAQAAGLATPQAIALPANNHLLVFRNDAGLSTV